jgi:uncharacterized protein
MWCACLLLGACASEPDHFYTLNTLPEGPRAGLSSPTVHVLLSVSVPSLVDRAEMVISTSSTDILVLDHERWPGTLSEQVSRTLARDIEKRRADVLIGDRGFDQGATPPVTMKVDIVSMSARRGGNASIEVHWRIVDAGANVDMIGSDVFETPLEASDYAAVAKAYSRTLSSLADKLAAGLSPRS